MGKVTQNKKTSAFRFATGLFALTLITQLFHGFNLNYYVEETGMVNLYLASVCKIIFVVVDGLNDIIFGALSEKTRSRWGKRLPWLVGGMPFLAFFVLMSYAVNQYSGFSQMGFFFYYLIISIMLENASTIMYINYGSLYPVLFLTDKERSKTSIYRHLLELVAMAICYVCTPILYEATHSYLLIGAIYTVIYMVSMSFCITGMDSRAKAMNTGPKEKPYSLIKTFKDVFHNKPFMVYHFAQSFFQAILALMVSIYPMYCKHVLHVNGYQQAILMGALFGSLVISIPVWFKLINKYGFRRMWELCFVCLPIGLFLLTFPQTWWQGIIAVMIIGPFAAGLMLTPDMMSAELIDIDKMKNRVAREASFNSIGFLISRFSLILSAIAMSVISFAFGYNSGSDPGPNPEFAFRFMCGILFPIICALGTIFSIIYIKISRQDSEKLKEHKLKQEEPTLLEE